MRALIRAACFATTGLLGLASAQTPAGRNFTENPFLRAGTKEEDKSSKWFQVLKDFNIDLKAFENSGEEASLGFSYDYERSWGSASFTRAAGYDLNLSMRGSVALDDTSNPEDFLQSKLSGRLFGALGSAREEFATEVFRDQLDDLDERIANEEDKTKRIALLTEKSELERRATRTSAWCYGSIDANVGFESNQRFTARNWTGGLRAGLDFKSLDNQSALASWNVFDWPFSALRLLTGYDDSWRSRGSAFPTVIGMIDYVEPDGMTTRAMVGDTSAYWRVGAEVAMRTPIFKFKETRYHFHASYRYFRELDPSAAVENAGFDDSSYWALAITSEEGLFVTYRSGELPFDISSDEAFEVGWKLHF